MRKGISKKVLLAIALAAVFTVDAMAQSTSLSGSSGSYTTSGTDTYGFSEVFTKVSNFLSDNGLNKIFGFGGSATGIVMAYNKAYVSGALTAVVSMIVGFLPKVVDGAYGAII